MSNSSHAYFGKDPIHCRYIRMACDIMRRIFEHRWSEATLLISIPQRAVRRLTVNSAGNNTGSAWGGVIFFFLTPGRALPPPMGIKEQMSPGLHVLLAPYYSGEYPGSRDKTPLTSPPAQTRRAHRPATWRLHLRSGCAKAAPDLGMIASLVYASYPIVCVTVVGGVGPNQPYLKRVKNNVKVWINQLLNA